MSNNQTGFKKYLNTIEQTIWLSQEIKDNLQNKQSMIAILIDF